MSTKRYGELAQRHGKRKYNISGPKTTHAYLIDAVETSSRVPYLHDNKLKAVRDILENQMDCEVTNVSFPRESNLDVLQEYFREELRGKGERDLILIYYHGHAAFSGREYMWHFEKSGPRRGIDVYPLIQVFVDSGVNAMFILDCNYTKNSQNKWVPSRDDQKMGNIEFICGGHVENEGGGKVEGGPGDFTTELCNTIESFVTGIDKPLEEGGWAGYDKPLSLLQLLAKNKDFRARPNRQFLTQTRKGGKQDIDRFVIKPEHVRETGKISWHAKHIQGEKAIAEPAEGPHGEGEEDVQDAGQAARQNEAQEQQAPVLVPELAQEQEPVFMLDPALQEPTNPQHPDNMIYQGLHGAAVGKGLPNPMFVGQDEDDEDEGVVMEC